MRKQWNSIWVLTAIACLVLGSGIEAAAQDATIEKTGQPTCYDSDGNVVNCSGTGQDGDIQAGVAWPGPRFTDNGDGTVSDNLTGLIWMDNANCIGADLWANALSYCNTLADGSCGLTDGSGTGDWRLPNIQELNSLIDLGETDPALPMGHPFSNVQSSFYWSSSTNTYSINYAWYADLHNGNVGYHYKYHNYYMWCVRE